MLHILNTTILTQGTTATPSKIGVYLNPEGRLPGRIGRSRQDVYARVRVCNDGTFANHSAATIAPTDGCTIVETHTANKDLTLKSSDVGQATAVLTLDTQPTAGDTFTLGATVYTMMDAGTANSAGEINLGANLAATKPLIVAAINGDANNDANEDFTAAAFSGNTCTLTAVASGTEGNGIATTETFTAGTNVFGAAESAGGTDEVPEGIFFELTLGTPGTATVRVGQPEVGGVYADYREAQQVVHEAP
jgi:hypothetical protein